AWDRKAGPWPGRGPTPVTRSSTATRVGRPARRAMVTQVRGRVTSLRSSTRSIGALPRPGEAQVDVLQGGALDDQLADPDPAVDQAAVEGLGGGAVEVDGEPVGAALAQPHPGQGRRQGGRGGHRGGGG